MGEASSAFLYPGKSVCLAALNTAGDEAAIGGGFGRFDDLFGGHKCWARSNGFSCMGQGVSLKQNDCGVVSVMRVLRL